MKRRSKFLSVIAALALAVAPLAWGVAVASLANRGLASLPQATAASAQSHMVGAETPAPADDCCLLRGSAEDPCTSAACCGAHCVSVTSVFQSGFRLVAAPVCRRLAPRDQVLASIAASPPFRPPRG